MVEIKTNAIGDGFTRLASPLTANTSPLFSTTLLSSIGISIWLRRMMRLRKRPPVGQQAGDGRRPTALWFFATISSVTMRISSEIAIKPSLPLRAGIEHGVRRISDRRNLIAHLRHRIAIRIRQNTVTANTFDIATCLAVNTQRAGFAVSRAVRTNPIGADNRK